MYMQSHTYTYMYIYICILYIYMYMYMYTCIHTYICTYIYTLHARICVFFCSVYVYAHHATQSESNSVHHTRTRMSTQGSKSVCIHASTYACPLQPSTLVPLSGICLTSGAGFGCHSVNPDDCKLIRRRSCEACLVQVQESESKIATTEIYKLR